MGYHVLGVSFVNFLMTIDAFRPILYLEPVCVFLAVAMHLLTSVAPVTRYVHFSMHARLGTFMLTEIFLPYPAPMARGTNLLHGGLLLKEVTIQKSAFNGIWPANVALTATAVTVKAVGIHGAC
jgi:hypothetical protein